MSMIRWVGWMFVLTVLIALLLGCATPGDIVETGERTTRELSQRPDIAAACMTRNVERIAANFSGQVRPLSDTDLELLIRVDSMPQTVVHIAPTASGSVATIWRRPDFFRTEDFANRMARGC